jgi:hypothetical protein
MTGAPDPAEIIPRTRWIRATTDGGAEVVYLLHIEQPIAGHAGHYCSQHAASRPGCASTARARARACCRSSAKRAARSFWSAPGRAAGPWRPT